MFVKATNGNVDQYPYTIGQLRRDNPSTSFPKSIPDETLAEYDVYRVEPVAAPDYDVKTTMLIDGVESINGSWRQNWVEQRLPEDRASRNVRAYRDDLLSKTDWVVVMHTEKGTNIPLEWEVYRQALRDITNSEAFPYLTEDDWPVKP